MGPSVAGVFVPHSWTLLPSDDGSIVQASTGPTPPGRLIKPPFIGAAPRNKQRRRGRGRRKPVMEVWKGRGDGMERRVRGTKERSVLDGRALVKKKKKMALGGTSNKLCKKVCKVSKRHQKQDGYGEKSKVKKFKKVSKSGHKSKKAPLDSAQIPPLRAQESS